jgi:hypothetical protein
MDELITIEIIAIYIRMLSITRGAFDGCGGFAMTTILKLLNCIAGWRFTIPFVNNNIIINRLIPAVLTSFLFASKSSKNYNGNGNGYFFHNG